MWGRLRCGIAREIIDRNTPTHVGKTEWAECEIFINQKHPHACGEDWKVLV